MLQVGSYVTLKGTDHPTGIVEALYGIITATVRWGVDHGQVFREDLNQEDLEVVTHHIENAIEDEAEVVHRNIFDPTE